MATWGSSGSGNGQFNSPRGVAVDCGGNIYVADTANHRIQKLNADGVPVATWGSYGSGNGQFSNPNGLAVDSEGNIYVADLSNHRIQKLNAEGTHVATWGSFGSGNGQFRYPRGLAVDSGGNIYVADSNNHRIQKLNAEGTPVATWGSSGSGNGQFNNPDGVAIDSGGNIYVADINNHRIQKLNAEGTHEATWGSPGSGDGQFNYPRGVAVDSGGNIYVADTENHRIQFMDVRPIIIETIPLDGGASIFIDQNIIINYNENIFPSDGIYMITIKKEETEIEYTYQINEKTLTINPNENLDYFSIYTVNIPKEAIKDSANYHLENNYTFSFTTGPAPDLSAPYVINTEPVNHETKVAIDQDIETTFSETILEKNINLLTLKNGTTVVDYDYNITDNQLTINPNYDLDYGTLYTVTIPSGTVQDYVYNQSDAFAFNFTTINNNADLSNIQLSNGSLNPNFAPNTTDYEVNVGYSISSIAITPTLDDINGKVEVNGNIVISNTLSNPISLNVGNNTINVLVTAEDTVTTKEYTITVKRGKNNNQNSGSGESSGNGVSVSAPQNQTTTPNTPEQNDQLLRQSLEKTREAILSLKNIEPPIAKISVHMIQALTNKEKSLTIENTGIKVSFHPNSLNTSQIIKAAEDENSFVELRVEALTEREMKEVLEKAPFGENTGIFELGGKVFDLTAYITITNEDGTTSTEKIDSFTEPVAITIDLSDIELTDEDIEKLSGVRYETDENGEIRLVKLGGSYDKERKTFTFYTDQFSLYSIIKVNKLTTINLTIDQLKSIVNNEIKTNDVAPIIINNRTMVPVRFIAENLGAEVRWDAETRTVFINLEGKILSMIIDEPLEDFDTSPTIVNNRTLVPIRYISEKLGANVVWFSSNKTVSIVK
ncbi:MAG: hypothetical protein CVV02_18305 [Firmicutes bacterium HGW-Firmicutes-7]|nr:MAG: hypothetical protein CVV02_18305 [Firmicutes bacterium HGW-Firmicutes-7]